MCGIAGMIGQTDARLLERMTDRLSHRGPDDSGFYLSETAALGHRRLSVIDIEGGRQPLADETGAIQLVCNGEIYNYRELRASLEAKGHMFASRSDSEVILHSYEDYGDECVHKLRGMFAFAIWDSRRRRLLLARDRLGIKPLYYCQTDKRFLFASEIKALLADKGVQRQISYSALDKYLSFRFVPAPETMFRDIYKLEPGTMLTLTDAGVHKREYWSISFAASSISPSDQAPELFSRFLNNAIAEELESDRPLGTYLSGGLDSSYLTAIAAASRPEKLTTFSVAFEGQGEDESGYARQMADFLGTDHVSLKVGKPSWELLMKVAWHLDEPLGDLATIPTYQMASVTKPLVSVVLTGEGADELMAGYPQLKALAQAAAWPRWLPGLPAALLAGRYSQEAKQRFWEQRRAANQGSAFLAASTVFSETEKQTLLTVEAWTAINQQKATRRFVDSRFPDNRSYTENILAFYLRYWLADDLLLKNDKMTMAHAVEARVPYLDHRLVEYACGLPPSLRTRRGEDKYLLRQVAADVLPSNIAKRPKHGFTVPLASWLTGDLRRHCRELLSEGRSVESGLFKREALVDILDADLGDPFNRRAFATIVSFELWRESFGC